MAKKKSRFYLQMFIYITLCVAGTLLITSTILYMNFENIAIKQTYANDMEILLQSGKGISAMTDMATTLSNQIYNDFQVSKLRYYPDPDSEDLRAADIQLTNYRLSMPFIDSVYIYNGTKETFYINATIDQDVVRETIQTKEYFDDPFVSYLIDNFSKYKPFVPIPRKYILKSVGKTEKTYYTFFLYDAYLKENISSAVIVNISESWLTNFINENSRGNSSNTFIINSEAIVISSTDMFPILHDLSSNQFITRIRERSESGTFVDTIKGNKSLISFTLPDESGLQYIKVTPWKIVFAKIENMKTFTVILSSVLFAVGILYSLFTSRRLYRPLQKLITEKSRNAKLLIQVLFRDIFTGRGVYNEQSVQAKLEELGVPFSPDGFFCILLIKIDDYVKFSYEFNTEERTLLKAEINQTAVRIFSAGSWYSMEIIEMGNEGVAVVLHSGVSESRPDLLTIQTLAENFQSTVKKTLDISLTITISPCTRGILNLNEAYQKTVEASSYSIFSKNGSILPANLLDKIKHNDYEYPVKMEKQLINALMRGNADDAKHYYKKIIRGTDNYSLNVFKLTISRLAYSVIDAVKTIKRNNSISLDLEKDISIAVLNGKESVDEISLQFFKIFDDVTSILSDRKSNKSGKLTDEIDRYIQHNYRDPDLYIESIAEHLQKSPTYISHVYKQQTSKTILDKIIEIRMEKARILLLETSLPVSDIAEKTGFSSSSYFFKVFKKINGATPVSFKKNSKTLQRSNR